MEPSEKDLEINALREQLTRNRHELDEFSYIVSHDLRAPLRGILSLAKWLEEDYGDVLDQEGKQYLDKLTARTRGMNGMLESILTYSRRGRATLHPVELDSQKVTAALMTTLWHPESISIAIKPGLPVITTDKTFFCSIMEELIKNSIQHMGREKGHIEISCQSIVSGGAGSAEAYEFCVSDTGQGIEPKHHDMIFKMFRTLTASPGSQSQGAGLTLARKMVERCGGRIRVESEGGTGSRFYFTVPKGFPRSPAEELGIAGGGKI